MGDKSGRSGSHILYYFAAGCVIAAINLAACAPLQHKLGEIRARDQLHQYRVDLAEGFFDTVIEKSMQVIENNETKPPADVALYALGEVYAHHDFPGRDYYLSQYYFEKLIENFPGSELSSEAKTYISLFEAINAGEKDSGNEEKRSGSGPTAAERVGDEDFQGAVEKNLRVLKEADNQEPADEALYNLGLIYAHSDNPAKDYKKSQIYFHVLTKQFPESRYTKEAQVILGLFETIEKIQQIDIDIEQQKKQLIR